MVIRREHCFRKAPCSLCLSRAYRSIETFFFEKRSDSSYLCSLISSCLFVFKRPSLIGDCPKGMLFQKCLFSYLSISLLSQLRASLPSSETIHLSHTFKGGWQRNLIMEGIEPNPGPYYWGSVEKGVKEEFGSSFGDLHQQELARVEKEIRTKYDISDPLTAVPVEAVRSFFNEGGTSRLGGLIIEIVNRLSKQGKSDSSLPLRNYSPFLTLLLLSKDVEGKQGIPQEAKRSLKEDDELRDVKGSVAKNNLFHKILKTLLLSQTKMCGSRSYEVHCQWGN